MTRQIAKAHVRGGTFDRSGAVPVCTGGPTTVPTPIPRLDATGGVREYDSRSCPGNKTTIRQLTK